MNILNVAGVSIPVMQGDIGISVSGGADSALLLYILLTHATGHLHIFTLAKTINGRASAITSSKVIEKCIQLTGNNRITHHTSYADVQNKSTLFSLPIEYAESGKIKYMYTAVTANPPKNIADNFLSEIDNTEQSQRDPTVHRKVIDGNWIMPFFNVDKRAIHSMYATLGLMDSLFVHTFSCERENEIENYTHCGKCWWCKEREWGFGKV